MDGAAAGRYRGEHESANKVRRERFYQTHGYSRGRNRERGDDGWEGESGGRKLEDDAESRRSRYGRTGRGASASVSALRRHVEAVSARLEDEVRKLHQAERSPNLRSSG